MFVPIPTPEEMSCWDAGAAALGISEETLMENAAREAMSVFRHYAGVLTGLRVLLLAGSGNNGGDAFCMARHLLDAGASPTLVCTRDFSKCGGAAGHWFLVAKSLGIPIIPAKLWMEDGDFEKPDAVIDGLLGTGFHGVLRNEAEQLIRRLNKLHPRLLLSLDIPSGLDAHTGSPCPDAIRADVTVTFQAAKPGLLFPDAAEFTGVLEVRPIGIPRQVQAATPESFRTWLCPGQSMDAAAPWTLRTTAHTEYISTQSPLPALQHSPAHKGEAGRVLILGGSAEYSGAPHLAAIAAMRAGAGLITISGPDPVLNAARSNPAWITKSPAVAAPCPTWDEASPEILPTLLHGVHAAVIGPGLDTGKGAVAMLTALLSLQKRPPLVIDAGALAILAEHPRLLPLLSPHDILTPHPGEAARLLGTTSGEVQSDRINALNKLTKLATAVWVLKGKGTLIAVPQKASVISPWNVPQLAVAGSGDVLSGLAGALLAQGHTAETAAVRSVWIHALAGIKLAEQFPSRGNFPQDIADTIPSICTFL